MVCQIDFAGRFYFYYIESQRELSISKSEEEHGVFSLHTQRMLHQKFVSSNACLPRCWHQEQTTRDCYKKVTKAGNFIDAPGRRARVLHMFVCRTSGRVLCFCRKSLCVRQVGSLQVLLKQYASTVCASTKASLRAVLIFM